MSRPGRPEGASFARQRDGRSTSRAPERPGSTIRRRRVLAAAAAAGALAACGTPTPGSSGPTAPRRAGVERSRGRLADGGWRGFNVACNALAPHRTAATWHDLRATGATLVRTMLPARLQQGRVHWDLADRAGVLPLLDGCEAAGLAVVLGLDLDAARSADAWRDAGFADAVVRAWEDLGRSFGGHPALLALDLLNEPDPPRPGGDLAHAWRHWSPLAQRLVERLRAVGVTRELVVQPVFGGLPAGFSVLQPLAGDGVVYGLHQYTPHEITHQGVVPRWPRGVPYPAEARHGLLDDAPAGRAEWDAARLAWALRHVVSFARGGERPVYVGEFGCVRWAPGASADRYVADCLAAFERHRWSWTYHEFRGWPGWDPERPTEAEPKPATPRDTALMRLFRRQMADAR